MAGDEGELRKIIREEIENSNRTNNTPRHIYRRTQGLINDAVHSCTRDFRSSFSPSTSSATTSSSSPSATTAVYLPGTFKKKQKFSPGHPYRLTAVQSKKKSDVTKPLKSVEVWLLDVHGFEDSNPEEERPSFGEGGFSEINFSEEMVILKGTVQLNPLETFETAIRQSLCEVFSRKFTLISPSDFFYVKRERNKLVCLETGPGHSWGFQNLRRLWGQGKLYCVLKGQYRDLVIGDNNDTKEKEIVKIEEEEGDKKNDDLQKPCCSRTGTYVDIFIYIYIFKFII